MKKTYMKLFALAMMLVAATTASAQNTIDIEDGMFKAWDSPDPGANEVAPEDAIADDGAFGFENNMYKNVGGGAVIYGHNFVYYLWYADLTGTQTIDFEATPGMQLRVLMNRPVPDGSDSHGGATVERKFTMPDSGTYTLDVSDLEYVHLNCIKTDWGSPANCKVRSIKLNGSLQGSGETHQPIELLSAGYQADVVCVSLSDLTNLKELTGSMSRLIFPNDCVSVKVNGEAATIMSVEGMEGNKLFIFLDEGYPEGEDDEVLVSFTNPSSPHLVFSDGRFEGEDVPSFTDMKAEYQEGLGEYYSYMAATPELVSATPEGGSFNLPTTLNTFVLTFSANVNCDEVQATLGGTTLTIAPATGFAKELTLTWTGGELSGEKTLVVSNIKPEMDFLETVGEVTLTYSFGPVVIDPNDQPVEYVSASAFNDCANGGIPAGFIVNFNGEERTSEGSYGSGPRMMVFGEGGDFTKGLYIREGYAETEDAIEMQEGKKYVISFNSAQWKDSGRWMKFDILDENWEPLYDELGNPMASWMIDNQPNVNGSYNAVKGSTFTSITFIPEVGGSYYLRWSATNDQGTVGWNEILLANVVVRYVPSTAGVEWMYMVQDAIDAATTALSENGDERYLGNAYSSLTDLIRQYSDFTQFTSPSSCLAAVADLEAAVEALKDHRAVCDAYDALIKRALDVVRQNANNKFTGESLYEQIVAAVAKYNGKSEWVNNGTEEEPAYELIYEYDVLKADSELDNAIDELTPLTNLGELLFTEGASNPEKAGSPELTGTTHFFGLDSNGRQKSNGTGVAVLTNRLLLGAETLMRLGATEENPVIQAFLNAMDDDDQIAEQLKAEIVKELKLQKDDLFQEKTDEATLETYIEPVDLTVYVKNPNIYKQQANMSFNADNVPGWTVPEGFQAPGITVGWNHVGENDDVAVDCMFSTWDGAYRVEQTITDLPSGTYTIKGGLLERDGGTSEEALADTYFYVNTTNGEKKAACTVGGQAFPFAFSGLAIENVKVTDGKLTIGVNAASGTHTFFNDVRVYMTAFDGAAAVKGDVNADGKVDVADITQVIAVMAAGTYTAAADVNGDKEVDVADISQVISIMASTTARAQGQPLGE